MILALRSLRQCRRLIIQPIYQYTEKDSEEKSGGGVFLFCQGTDPEMILLLVAHAAGSKLAWHYAVAPFTDYALAAQLDGKEVWSLAKGHRPTRTTPHWWNGSVESKTLSTEEEAELAKGFKASEASE
jgi:hypothetical protein